jgi:hypothetical protein
MARRSGLLAYLPRYRLEPSPDERSQSTHQERPAVGTQSRGGVWLTPLTEAPNTRRCGSPDRTSRGQEMCHTRQLSQDFGVCGQPRRGAI